MSVLRADDIYVALQGLTRSPDSCQHVYSTVDLSDGNLTNISELSRFPHLQKVNVSGNAHLENLEDGLKEHVHLAVLDASRNCLWRFPDLRARALTEIRLSDNYMQELGESVCRHQFLRVLDCSNNQLTTLEELGALRNLTNLDVSNNAIRSLRGIEALPLSELYIGNNALCSLAEAPPLPMLRFLDVSSNLLEDLRGLSQYKCLTVLRACENNITTLKTIHVLDSLPLLRELNLNGNEVQTLLQYRLEVLFVLPGLELLDAEKALAESKLAARNLHDVYASSDEGARKSLLPQGELTTPETLMEEQRSLADNLEMPVLKTPKSLWSFFAESGFFSVWEEFLHALRERKTPADETVDLENIPIGECGLKAICYAFDENKSLRSLLLRGALHPRRWSSRVSPDLFGLKEVFASPSIRSRLTTLSLQDCRIGVEESLVIASALPFFSSLYKLDLSLNDIGSDRIYTTTSSGDGGSSVLDKCPGLAAIASAVAKCSTLTELDLSSNHLIDKSAGQALECLLKTATSLRRLNISDNAFDANATIAILSSLRQECRLESLSMRSCSIAFATHANALRHLGKSLACPECALRQLDIAFNDITDEGVQVICASNNTLQSLCLNEVSLTNIAALSAFSALRHLRLASNASVSAASLPALFSELNTLDISQTTFDENTVPALQRMLDACPHLHTLLLASSSMSYLQLAKLSSSFRNAAHLRTLDLTNHELDNACLEALSASTSLRNLVLTGCRLPATPFHPSEALESLSLASTTLVELPTFANLQILDLARLKLNAEGTIALTSRIQNAPLLHSLSLDGVLLGAEDSTRDLIKALVRAPSLASLRLSNARLGEIEYGDIGRELRCAGAESALRALDLAGNNADKDSMQIIANMLACNPPLQRLRAPQLAVYTNTAEAADEDATFQSIFHLFEDSLCKNTSLQELDLSEIVRRPLGVEDRKRLDAFLRKSSSGNDGVLERIVTHPGTSWAPEPEFAQDLVDNSLCALLSSRKIRRQTETTLAWEHIGTYNIAQ